MSAPHLPLVRFGILSTLSILVLSLYLMFHHVEVRGGFLIGESFCSWDSSFDCDAVARSDASELLGLPVAGWGIIASLILLALFVLPRIESGWNAKRFLSVLRVATGVQALGSVTYAGVSIFGIGKICILCTAVHLISILLFIVIFRRGRAEGSSFGEGVDEISQFLFAAGDLKSNRRVPALLSALAMIFLYITVFLSPPFLVLGYFQPREARIQEREEIKNQLTQFRTGKPREIPVTTEGAPEDIDFSRGSESATVTAVIYSDFECPHCRSTAKLFHELEKTLPIKTVFKNFPLDNDCNPAIDREFHQFACKSAEIARCAGFQGKFWEAHDQIFAAPDINGALLEQLPAALALNVEDFQQCLTTGAGKKKIVSDVKEGLQLKLRGTPAVFLNGRALPGADRQSIEAAIKEITAGR